MFILDYFSTDNNVKTQVHGHLAQSPLVGNKGKP